MPRSKDEGKKIVQQALKDLGQGCLDSLDVSLAVKAIKDTLEAMKEQARVLRNTKLDEPVRCPSCKEVVRVPLSAKDIAQTISYTSRTIDDTARLVEFVQGRADSRPDLGSMRSFTDVLTDDQLKILESWVAQGEKRTLQ